MPIRKDVLRPLFGTALLSLSALVGWQCFEIPEAPVAPSADIRLSIPLADVKRSIFDAVTKDTSVVKRAVDSSFFFNEAQVGKPTGVDTIKVLPQKAGSSVGIGVIEVAGIPTTSTAVALGSIPGMQAGVWPPLPPPFDTTSFPASAVSAPPVAFGDTTQFDFVGINSGVMTLTVTNRLPVQINFSKPIVLKNNKQTAPVDTSIIASFSIGLLDSVGTAGASKTVQANLAGKVMRNALSSDSIRFTTVSRKGPFVFLSSHGLSFSFGSGKLIADSASAVVPNQTLTSINDTTIVVDSTIVLEQASFRTGGFTLRVTKKVRVDVGVRLKFDNFVSTKTDSSFVVDDIIQASDTVKNITVAFDTVVVKNRALGSNPKGTAVRFSVGVRTVSSVKKAIITSADFVRADFLPSQSFTVKSIVGKTGAPQIINIFSAVKGPSIGDLGGFFSGDLLVNGSSISLDLGLTGGYPVEYNLKMIAKNLKKGIVDTLDLPPPTGSSTKVFTPVDGTGKFILQRISFNNQSGLSSFINKFLADFPKSFIDSFIIKGTVTVRVDNNTPIGSYKPTLYDTTKFYNGVNVYFPLDIGLANGTIRDTLAMVKGVIPKDFTKSIKSGKINMEVENRIPLQLKFWGEVKGRLTPTSPYRTLLKLPTSGDTLIIQPAPAAGGFASAAQKSGFSFQLADFGKQKVDPTFTLNDAELFNLADSLYLNFQVVTTPGPQTVKLRVSDYIRTRMSGSLIYTVNKK